MLIYCDQVRAEWVDYNGHLRDAFYLLLFSLATDALMDHIGLDHPGSLPAPVAGEARRGHSLFTLECHLHYLHEVRQGAQVEVLTRLLAHDAKRLHLYSSLHLAGQDKEMAAAEQMQLHVDMAGPSAAVFLPEVLARVEALAREDAPWPRPARIGKIIGLPRR
jgi:acyl-CoA thioester hydrolase